MINNSIEDRLIEIINKNFFKQDIKMERYNFLDKNTLHITFLISPQTFALSKVVNSLKTSTSRLIRKEFSKELTIFDTNEGFWEQEYKIYT